jgi:hypothetical protein
MDALGQFRGRCCVDRSTGAAHRLGVDVVVAAVEPDSRNGWLLPRLRHTARD